MFVIMPGILLNNKHLIYNPHKNPARQMYIASISKCGSSSLDSLNKVTKPVKSRTKDQQCWL